MILRQTLPLAVAACWVASLGVATLGVATVGAAPAGADPVAEFYRGKTVALVVGHEVGSGYDVYGRVLARHLSRHIPGQPTIVVQNMVGAAGMIASNWLYNIAPRDGTVVASFSASPIAEPILGNPAARYEPAKFTWIGNMDESAGTCGVTKASGIGKFDDLLVRETIFGATAQTGTFGKFALAVKNLLGAKLRIVSGYKGSADVKIALGRGEVHGICGLPLSTITSHWRDDYESGNFRPVIQLSGARHPSLKSVPHVDDYAKSPEDLQVYGLIFGMQALGRFYVSPPAVPVDRRDALRNALASAMNDPQFRADAAKTQIDINPSSGAEVETFVARVAASSPAVIERSKRALRPD
jgi:tripartite-type tricarboxylate transporter receptor subunit TctC